MAADIAYLAACRLPFNNNVVSFFPFLTRLSRPAYGGQDMTVSSYSNNAHRGSPAQKDEVILERGEKFYWKFAARRRRQSFDALETQSTPFFVRIKPR